MKQAVLLCLAFALASCTDKAAAAKPAPAKKPAIITVMFRSTTGSVAPQYWRSYTLTVSQTLRTQYVVQGVDDNIIETKASTITQAQYDELTKALQDANYAEVTSTEISPPPVGGGTSALSVVTDKASYVFKGPSTAAFPPAIAAVYATQKQYMPQ